MKINSAEFIKSISAFKQAPNDNFAHVAFAGRSNVGKSSLLNTLLGRKKLVKVSSTPGKTQTINFFLINKSFFLVDLPGYGYAKVSKSLKYSWGKLIESYLANSEQLRCVVMLIDIRHPLQSMDRDLLLWLNENHIPVCLVGTKADKLSKNQLNKNLAQLSKNDDFQNLKNIIPFSAVTGQGKAQLWEELSALLP